MNLLETLEKLCAKYNVPPERVAMMLKVCGAPGGTRMRHTNPGILEVTRVETVATESPGKDKLPDKSLIFLEKYPEHKLQLMLHPYKDKDGNQQYMPSMKFFHHYPSPPLSAKPKPKKGKRSAAE